MEETQCRTCLGEALDLRLSVNRRVNGVSIVDMIEKLTQISIAKDEIFSSTICKKCFNDICNAYSFRKKFLDTERTLRGFEKKLLVFQGQSVNIKKENLFFTTDTENPKIEQDDDYDILEGEIEGQEGTTEYYAMEVVDETQNFETGGEESEEVQYVEYEQVEYLDGDNGNGAESNELLGFKTENEPTECVSFYCTLCEETFKTAFGIEHHSFFCHFKGQNPTICETCNIEFPIKNLDEEEIANNIKFHRACHAEGKIHSCTECFAIFKTLKQLESHKQTVHNIPDFSYLRCKICNTTFASTKLFNNHIAESKCKDIPEKHFKCYICNKIFNMGIAKKKHIQEAHQDKIGQDCPLCLRCKIPSAVAYENHYKTHFVAPRFSCNFCNRSFYESDRLQMHIRRFHDNTRYFCFFCSKDFRDKSGIARHILGVHFNARNFKCDICSKAFTASYNLKEHMFSIHKQASTIYTCDLCSQDYLYRKQFERHREKCQGVPEKRKR